MLADKLIPLRKSRGLTQEELASELFISRSMIAKYETGKAYPTNEILQKIADYFEISIDEFPFTVKNKQKARNSLQRSYELYLLF